MADAFLPPDIHIAHLFVVGVAVTAARTGPRVMALVGGLSVLALIAAGAERGTLTTESVLVELASLGVLGALLVFFTHLRQRRTAELSRARSVSDAAQRVVLRPLPDRAGPLSFALEYRSAEADTTIGGDLYAVARTDHATRLIVGDVRGKGMASISDTAIVLGAFRAVAHRNIALPELAAYVEDAVRWGLAEFSQGEEDDAERFVTAVMVDIPDDEPVIHVVSCGHPPPLLLHGAGVTALRVREPAPPLGLGVVADSAYVPTTFPFRTADRLVLYTDGFTEARNAEGVFYPLAERVVAWANLASRPLVQRIAADVRRYAGGRLHDDMAMVIAQRDRAPMPQAQ
ncbi:PP2C family protein-serine/threonine phosphatase [Streptomyces carpinensis]|nr:PP2C family protein-serine/threonine phosphatase [Streptomyces carpinensis]